jgi:hypothetical protein
MSLHFLTPEAALIVLAGLVPLALVAVVDRRNARARSLLGLPEPARRTRFGLPVAVALLAAVLGVAAAQPVLRQDRSRLVRTDAELLVAVDTSRSMAASTNAASPTRLDRARAIGYRLRAGLPSVPMGLATFTDRPLPILLPTDDAEAFTAAVHDSLGIEDPPGLTTSTTISSFDAVAPFPLEGYFSPKIKRRVLVIVTDAESTAFNEAGVRASFKARPRTAVVLIRMGAHGERVFGPDGAPESAYIPPPATGDTLRQFLSATRGKAFGEKRYESAITAARSALGTGPQARIGKSSNRRELAPWLVLAGVFPLGFVLRRRNF